MYALVNWQMINILDWYGVGMYCTNNWVSRNYVGGLLSDMAQNLEDLRIKIRPTVNFQYQFQSKWLH